MKKRRSKKRGNMWPIIFILALLVVVLSIICVLVFYKHAKNQNEEEPQTETEEVISTEEQTEEVPEEETDTEEISVDEMGFIFVGESHMVVADAEYAGNGSDIDGIEYDSNLFFVQTGLNGWMGTAEWLLSEDTQDGEEGALRQIDSILQSHDFKKCYIFIQHGSSMSQYQDQWSIYETVYKTYEERYHDCELYVISVPPVQEKEFLEQTGFKRSNQSIRDFNAYTRDLLKEGQYLDYYDWFEKNGVYQDYIHFEGKTYKSLFTSIMGKILS